MGAWMRDKEKRAERNLERNKPQRPRDPGQASFYSSTTIYWSSFILLTKSLEHATKNL